MTKKQRAMNEAIEAAWSNPEGKELREKLFPNGRPTPDEFIRVVAEYAKRLNSSDSPHEAL